MEVILKRDPVEHPFAKRLTFMFRSDEQRQIPILVLMIYKSDS